MEQDTPAVEPSRAASGSLTRALVLSLLAAAVPILGAFLFPETLEDYEALMWLLLLVPAFLWAFERGWIGVATTLACGMALLSATYAVAEFFGRTVPGLLFAVVVAYVAITLGVGLLGDRFTRARYGAIDDTQAMRDPLTALPRRPQAEGHLAMQFAAAAARGQPLAVVLFALDDLEAYSARVGRAASDAALQIFAALLRKTTRRLDLSARYGSDTFISIVSGCSEAGALLFTARLKDLLRAAAHDRALPTVSVGIACVRADMTSPLEMLNAAEEALAAARRDGRDRVRIHAHAAATLPDLMTSSHHLGEEHSARPRSRDLDPLAVPSGELARDINHLLTMIDGHAERLVAAAGPRSELRTGLLAIRSAAERATTIARQLSGDTDAAALPRGGPLRRVEHETDADRVAAE
jgi:diguanylate cyclase (GGDEF)-like protein